MDFEVEGVRPRGRKRQLEVRS